MSDEAPMSGLTDAPGSIAGTISIWCAPLRATGTWYARLPDAPHYAASMMKLPLLVALYRAAEAGRLDLSGPLPVHDVFASARPGAAPYHLPGRPENDPAVWTRLGGTATRGWLAERMIVRSSNLAANLLLAEVGVEALAEVWQLAGARHSRTVRGIEDIAARLAGLDNVVTAADLGALSRALALGRLAGEESTRAMLDLLLVQEHRGDLPAGLPPGTPVAYKNGWVTGVRHAAAVVYPPDAPPYLLAACTTTGLSDPDARALLARIAAATWPLRRS
jgi:beta-lactamase class A